MYNEKLSISLSPILFQFIKQYQQSHACKTRSEVIQKALKLLREEELEAYYSKASAEVDASFDVTNSDGLEDETW